MGEDVNQILPFLIEVDPPGPPLKIHRQRTTGMFLSLPETDTRRLPTRLSSLDDGPPHQILADDLADLVDQLLLFEAEVVLVDGQNHCLYAVKHIRFEKTRKITSPNDRIFEF